MARQVEDLAPILLVGDRVRHRELGDRGVVHELDRLVEEFDETNTYFVRWDDRQHGWCWQGYLVKLHPLEELALEAP